VGITRLVTRSLTVIAVAAVLVGCAAAWVPTAAAAEETLAGAPARVDHVRALPRLESRLLLAINSLRRSQGLVPLRPNRALAAAAHQQSVSMAQHGFFAHASFSGMPFWQRVETKYRKPTSGSWEVGENLGWGSPRLSARSALELWLESPPHRKNLLQRDWRELGIGAVHASSAPGVYDGHDVTILTVDFGVRR
jgi:uncharacterized protein YkwD